MTDSVSIMLLMHLSGTLTPAGNKDNVHTLLWQTMTCTVDWRQLLGMARGFLQEDVALRDKNW